MKDTYMVTANKGCGSISFLRTRRQLIYWVNYYRSKRWQVSIAKKLADGTLIPGTVSYNKNLKIKINFPNGNNEHTDPAANS